MVFKVTTNKTEIVHRRIMEVINSNIKFWMQQLYAMIIKIHMYRSFFLKKIENWKIRWNIFNCGVSTRSFYRPWLTASLTKWWWCQTFLNLWRNSWCAESIKCYPWCCYILWTCEEENRCYGHRLGIKTLKSPYTLRFWCFWFGDYPIFRKVSQIFLSLH